MGKPLIMGRRTFDSIGRALPGRTSIVLSRQPGLALPDGVLSAGGIDEALRIARQTAVRDGVEECMVIGGEQVYRLFLDLAQRIYLTEIDITVQGDSWFPELAPGAWRETARTEARSQTEPGINFCFLTLDRAR